MPCSRIARILSALAVLVFGWSSVAPGQTNNAPVDADLLLRGGTLHLGDGKPARVGDVAIVGERLVAVGTFVAGEVAQVIDCRGRIVSPGFVDLHTHSDDPMLDNNTRAVTNFVTQGCTTLVTGNCGLGPFDVGAYYRQIDELGAGVNIAHLLPHGGLRREVMGSARREPTHVELERLKELTTRAMNDGAWGMSTGLVYEPSSYASTDELVELTRIVGQHGGIYASHIRNEGLELLSAVEEAMEVGRRANTPVHVSHFKSIGVDAWGLVREAAKMIEERRAAGERVTADQYPYTASSTTLEATVIPDWAFAGGRDALLARFEDDVEWPKVQRAMDTKLATLDGGQRLQIASHAPEPSWAGRRLSEIASEQKLDPVDLVVQMTRNGGAMVVNHSMNEEDVRLVMQLPWVATASDGNAFVPGASVPHPRNYGTFPRKIGHYAHREKVVTLEHAVRSSTGLPADILGLRDRGYLRAGYMADVVVWDRESIIDTATFENPHAYSSGIEHVFINGEPALVRGKATGALAGRALRHPGPASNGNPELDNNTIFRLDALLERWDRSDAPGCAVGVIRNGRFVYKRGCGSANLEHGTPITPASVFCLPSTSKQFTAACVALLVARGQLSLADDVRKYVPSMPAYEKAITVAHLLYHTSGIRDSMTLLHLAGHDLKDHWTNDDVIALIAQQKGLNFPPGEKHLFSNSGYVVLARIIETVSGKTLQQFSEENFFRPLGMLNTRWDDDRTLPIPGRVTSYQPNESGEFRRVFKNFESYGDSGLLTTLEDLLLWDRNLYCGDVGGPEFLEMMQSRGGLDNGQLLDYGFGLKHHDYRGLCVMSHDGAVLGFRAQMIRVPDKRFTVICLGNRADLDPSRLSKLVIDICLLNDARDHSAPDLTQYSGEYSSDELSTTYTIAVTSEGLTVAIGDGVAERLEATCSDVFEGPFTIHFDRDDEKTIVGFTLDARLVLCVKFLKK